MFVLKLKKGDEIWIVFFVISMFVLLNEIKMLVKIVLECLGYWVIIVEYVNECNEFDLFFIELRVCDLYVVFFDFGVKVILMIFGGFNLNQLLCYFDYEKIKQYLKILCGYFDIMVFSNVIYQKMGLVMYLGFYFLIFVMKKGIDYIIEYFFFCCVLDDLFDIYFFSEWSDDCWFLD